MITPVRKTSLAASVFEQLRDLILTAQLEPGSDLPAERQLSETLQVNRSAVREALKRLEQAGLIVIQHGGNTRVLDYRRHASLDLLEPLIQQDPERLDDLRALRFALLPEIARAAAEKAQSDQIDRLEMLAGLIQSDDAEQRRDLAHEFWNALVDASGNLAFQLTYNVIRRIDPEGAWPGSDEFSDLANAIAAGDTRGAALTTRAMLSP